MAIFAMGVLVTAPLVSTLQGRTLGAQCARIMGVLEQSREYAQAKGTYVYVCFAQDTDTKQLQVAILASTQGIGQFANASSFNNDLKPVQGLLRLDGVLLGDVSEKDFGQRTAASVQFLSAPAPSMRPGFPFRGSTLTTFEHVLRFNPRGEAELPVVSGPDSTRWSAFPCLEIGLLATTGLPAQPAAIQLGGLSGQGRLYRP